MGGSAGSRRCVRWRVLSGHIAGGAGESNGRTGGVAVGDGLAAAWCSRIAQGAEHGQNSETTNEPGAANFAAGRVSNFAYPPEKGCVRCPAKVDDNFPECMKKCFDGIHPCLPYEIDDEDRNATLLTR